MVAKTKVTTACLFQGIEGNEQVALSKNGAAVPFIHDSHMLVLLDELVKADLLFVINLLYVEEEGRALVVCFVTEELGFPFAWGETSKYTVFGGLGQKEGIFLAVAAMPEVIGLSLRVDLLEADGFCCEIFLYFGHHLSDKPDVHLDCHLL